MTHSDLIAIYREIAKNYPGGVLVSDKTGKIIHTNQSDTLVLPHDQMVGQTLADLVKTGVYSTSTILKCLETKQQEIAYLKRKNKPGAVTVSVPVLDSAGEIQHVIAYTLKKEVVYELTQNYENEANRTRQVLKYLSDSQNESMTFADPKMIETVQYAKQIAVTDSTVLLTGESGVGKDVIARFIHMNSRRNGQVFIPVNCAAIPPDLLESEFFGYVKGAFTGARTSGKAGLFELAENGTLFLDEIGELPLALQSKLLRTLDSGEVMRIGSEKIIKTNVRVVTATNRDLYQMVLEGRFRQDLYYRINVIPISIPPLRQRKADIVALAQAFLDQLNQKYNTQKFFSSYALESLQEYHWPGNVREVKNVVERIYVASPSQVLNILFPLSINEAPSKGSNTRFSADNCAYEGLSLKKATKQLEASMVQAALERNDGNVSRAAQELGITRACLYKKLENIRHMADGN